MNQSGDFQIYTTAHFNHVLAALSYDSLGQNGINRWIHVLRNVLKQNGMPELHSFFHSCHEIGHSKVNHLQFEAKSAIFAPEIILATIFTKFILYITSKFASNLN